MTSGRATTWEDIEDRLVLDPETGCRNGNWIPHASGYIYISFEGKQWKLHRLVYFHHNPNADRTLKVLHTCDNRRCGEITHFFSGTDQDNHDDMVRKGRNRQVRGEQHGGAKLTLKRVQQIRGIRRHHPEISQLRIAEVFGITQAQVSNVVIGKSWR